MATQKLENHGCIRQLPDVSLNMKQGDATKNKCGQGTFLR